MTAALINTESRPAPRKGTPLLQVRHLTTSFQTPAGLVQAVRDVSFDINRGEIVGLVGESGSGKTVTGLSLLRLLPSSAVTEGEILYENADLLKLGREDLRHLRGGRIAMIFQDPMTSLDPVFTIASQMIGAMRAHQSISKNDARDKAANLLKQVGINDVKTRMSQYPHQMSGGMRQRILIAMALANDPGLLIADEPTTALDVTIQAQIIRLLKDINDRTGMSIILVTHNLGVVAGACDRVHVMYGGRLVETGPADTVYHRPQHPYTAGLLASIIGPDPDRGQRLTTIEGDPPQLLDPDPGCSFAPRCRLVEDRCRSALPPLTSRGIDHEAACLVTEDAV